MFSVTEFKAFSNDTLKFKQTAVKSTDSALEMGIQQGQEGSFR